MFEWRWWESVSWGTDNESLGSVFVSCALGSRVLIYAKPAKHIEAESNGSHWIIKTKGGRRYREFCGDESDEIEITDVYWLFSQAFMNRTMKAVDVCECTVPMGCLKHKRDDDMVAGTDTCSNTEDEEHVNRHSTGDAQCCKLPSAASKSTNSKQATAHSAPLSDAESHSNHPNIQSSTNRKRVRINDEGNDGRKRQCHARRTIVASAADTQVKRTGTSKRTVSLVAKLARNKKRSIQPCSATSSKSSTQQKRRNVQSETANDDDDDDDDTPAQRRPLSSAKSSKTQRKCKRVRGEGSGRSAGDDDEEVDADDGDDDEDYVDADNDDRADDDVADDDDDDDEDDDEPMLHVAERNAAKKNRNCTSSKKTTSR